MRTQLFVSHESQDENESGDDENSEWKEQSEEVNMENDEVHKDEEPIEGKTKTSVDVLETQASVELNQEKTGEKED